MRFFSGYNSPNASKSQLTRSVTEYQFNNKSLRTNAIKRQKARECENMDMPVKTYVSALCNVMRKLSNRTLQYSHLSAQQRCITSGEPAELQSCLREFDHLIRKRLRLVTITERHVYSVHRLSWQNIN